MPVGFALQSGPGNARALVDACYVGCQHSAFARTGLQRSGGSGCVAPPTVAESPSRYSSLLIEGAEDAATDRFQVQMLRRRLSHVRPRPTAANGDRGNPRSLYHWRHPLARHPRGHKKYRPAAPDTGRRRAKLTQAHSATRGGKPGVSSTARVIRRGSEEARRTPGIQASRSPRLGSGLPIHEPPNSPQTIVPQATSRNTRAVLLRGEVKDRGRIFF